MVKPLLKHGAYLGCSSCELRDHREEMKQLRTESRSSLDLVGIPLRACEEPRVQLSVVPLHSQRQKDIGKDGNEGHPIRVRSSCIRRLYILLVPVPITRVRDVEDGLSCSCGLQPL